MMFNAIVGSNTAFGKNQQSKDSGTRLSWQTPIKIKPVAKPVKFEYHGSK